MEWFFDYLFLGNWTKIAVSCPQELLDKNNNGSDMKKRVFTQFASYLILPSTVVEDYGLFNFLNTVLHEYESSRIYFYYVGIVLLSSMLLLNRKRFIKSLPLRLFTNYYLGSLFLQFFFVVFDFLYDRLIWQPLKSKYVWCVKLFPTYEIYYPTRYEEYLIVFDIYIRNISSAYQTALKHILPIFLILHRATTYYACAEPIIFQRYFSNKRLKIYYPFSGFIIYILHYIAYTIAIKMGDNFHLDVYNAYVNIGAALLLVVHVIMAIFSIQVVIKFRQSSKTEMQEFKSFLGFSMGPVIISIIEQMFLLSSHYLWTMNTLFKRVKFTWIMSMLSNLLYDIQPEYLCILYFLFVPFYRKLLYQTFCCFKMSSKTEVQILSTTNASKNP